MPIEFLELELLKLEKMGLKCELLGKRYRADNGRTELADVKIHKHNGELMAPADKIPPQRFPRP